MIRLNIDRRAALVILILLSTAAGCGAGGSDKKGEIPKIDSARVANAPSTEDVCKLVSKSEVEQAVGVKFTEGEDPSSVGAAPPINLVGMRFCRFRSESRPPAPGGTVTVGLATAYGPEVFDKYRRMSVSPDTEAQSSLGDKAVWSESTGALVVLQDRNVVGVSIFSNDPRATNRKAIAEKLFARALRRL